MYDCMADGIVNLYGCIVNGEWSWLILVDNMREQLSEVWGCPVWP